MTERQLLVHIGHLTLLENNPRPQSSCRRLVLLRK